MVDGAATCVPRYVSGRHLIDINVSHTTRPLLVDVPAALGKGVVENGLNGGGMVGFHGWHSNPWYYDKLSNATNFTRHFGMVLALPFGTAPVESKYCCPVDVELCSSGNFLAADLNHACAWNSANNLDVDDVAYTRAIAEFLVEDMCVEKEKIFVMGLSMGGSMAARVACEASEYFAGIATMSGSLAMPTCQPSSPLTYVEFCGTEDAGCNRTSSVTFRKWSALNQCQAQHFTYESSTTRCRVSTQCGGGGGGRNNGTDRFVVEQCFVAGLGDDIPGHDREQPIIPNTTYIPQAASNIDSVKYAFDRFSALFPSPLWDDTIFEL